MNSAQQIMSNCQLCPRNCGANRTKGSLGFCRVPSELIVARAALHHWEEPCISGGRGSGAVFFSGCNLRCIYCQNHEISGTDARLYGQRITIPQLADILLRLQNEEKAHNINLVTATPYIPQVAEALRLVRPTAVKNSSPSAPDCGRQQARHSDATLSPSSSGNRNWLHIPVIFNCGGYEKPESLRLLDGLVDIYLPDLKYMDPELAKRYSSAPDYPETAKAGLAEMFRQTGPVSFDSEGMLQKGMIVRHLLLPGHVRNGMAVIDYLYKTYGDRIYMSLMSQYTPTVPGLRDPLLNRRITRREYSRFIDHAIDLGVKNAFIQERETARESFIPAFDGTGIRPAEQINTNYSG